jgi:SAM-dependent methyltransferase
MALTKQVNHLKDIPWFKRWFNSDYYNKLYGNHNEQEAADFVNELVWHLQPQKGYAMLDVGCGSGRHCRQLASKGFTVTGIDLASLSIRQAKKWETDSLHFMRHDMRSPFGNNCFDYVFNFFTSFGYFKSGQENNGVIRNMADALKQRGTLVLDYMNVHYSEEHLVPYEEKEIDGIIYYITRWMDENFFYKKIVIDQAQAGERFENVEQVARFTLDDFTCMFSRNGFRLKEVFGDYQLNHFKLNSSPRLIVIANKL